MNRLLNNLLENYLKEHLTVAMLVIDNHGAILSLNRGFIELTGADPDSPFGDIVEVFSPGSCAAVLNELIYGPIDGKELFLDVEAGVPFSGKWKLISDEKRALIFYEGFAHHEEDVLFSISRINNEMAALNRELSRKNRELEALRRNFETVTGLLPICASCKSIRDNDGYWKDVAAYIEEHSGSLVTHGICPRCAEKQFARGSHALSAREDE